METTLTIVNVIFYTLFVIILTSLSQKLIKSRDFHLSKGPELKEPIKRISIAFARLMKQKTTSLIRSVERAFVCHTCEVLQESLDVERDRVNTLITKLTRIEKEDDETEFKPIETKRRDWHSTALRLRQRIIEKKRKEDASQIS